jgi:hypothetical protein
VFCQLIELVDKFYNPKVRDQKQHARRTQSTAMRADLAALTGNLRLSLRPRPVGPNRSDCGSRAKKMGWITPPKQRI